MKRLALLSTLLLALLWVACGGKTSDNEHDDFVGFIEESDSTEVAEPVFLYGIDTTPYIVGTDSVRKGDTAGAILNRYGISARKVANLERKADTVFKLSKIRADRTFTTFVRTEEVDSVSTREVLDYLVYNIDNTEYTILSFVGDSVHIVREKLPVHIERRCVTAEITSSLWGAIMKAKLPYALADEVEDLFKWSVDFFGIQEGDSFSVIFDEKMVEDKSVGIGRVYGARFKKGKKTFYAIPYADANGRLKYWDYDGRTMKKQMLQAPLKYTRISSKFTYKRLHPVYRVYRPHTGVDYSAPMGTPVHTVADGTVVKAGWGGGGGNTIYIEHAGGLKTGYLHLKSFAKGIKVGAKVVQGQTIGYVGSTGTSTGPHLDYRIWQNGKPIDPLQVTEQPSEPIAKQHRAGFEKIRERLIAEMDGTIEPDDIVTEEDIYRREKKKKVEPADTTKKEAAAPVAQPAPAEKKAEAEAEKKAEAAAEKSAEKEAEKATEEPTEEVVEKVAEKPAQTTTTKSKSLKEAMANGPIKGTASGTVKR